ncbi:importin-5-like isoform X2 [Tachypleus tridentatus]|uniref:importin-5-like isoform X2 n=1 Tax=Tachypleus tridentatus TaxID=6853 RepID=UPI003FD3161F
MAEGQGDFDSLLSNLLSTNNDIRSKSEETYDNIPVERRIVYLMNSVSSNGNSEEIRQLGAVLLRRTISGDFENFFPKLNPESQAQLKNQLLFAVQQDLSPQLRKKICEAASEFAKNLIDEDGNNHWPEFLKFLFDCASSQNMVYREASLQMFTAVPGIFGNQQNRYLDVIRQMLLQSLQDPTNLNVCLAAVKATTAFLVAHEKEHSIQKHFTDCLLPLLQVLQKSLEHKEDDVVLRSFVDLAESCPRFLRSQLDSLLQTCLKIISEPGRNDSWRHLALEIIVTLSETAPAVMRKLATKHIAQLVPLVFNMMIDLEDEDNWAFSEEILDDDNDSNPVVGETGLDRLACALGGKVMLPLVINILPAMLSSADWKHRHAGLMAVSAIGEGCHRHMEASLPQLVDGILPYLQDPNPRVQYAACNALGQMSTDFAPTFEKKFHDKVLPGLLLLLENPAYPRVQAHAGAALVNFFEDCPKSVLTPYLDKIINSLEIVLSSKFKELVEKGTKLVLEQVVVTLSAVADSAEEKFVQYYDRFMPCLKYIIQNANTEELRLLRGKTIECVSLIGLAVGQEKFVNDASDVMNMLLKTQTDGNTISEDDPQLSYMISAWARICKILGKQFEPYLPCVMGPVLKAASMKPEIALLDTYKIYRHIRDTNILSKNTEGRKIGYINTLFLSLNGIILIIGKAEFIVSLSMVARYWKKNGENPISPRQFIEQIIQKLLEGYVSKAKRKGRPSTDKGEDMKVVEGDDDWQFVNLGEQQNFGIRTVGLEEKATACQMLVCYARELKEGFAAYVEDVVKLMVPLLRFYFHDGVRSAAAECLPYLLECARIRGEEYVAEMWQYICPELLKSVDSEPEKEVLSEQMHAVSKCIEVLGRGCLREEHMAELLKVLDKSLGDHFERARERQEKRKDEDYDELVEEELIDEDDEDVYILSKVADILHSLFSTHKQEFLPCFDHLVHHFVRLLGPERPWTDHQWGICVFDDVIEYGGSACLKYQQYFLKPMLDALVSVNPEVRQASAYGFGVMGQFAGEGFAKTCAEVVPLLVHMINMPDSRSPENLTATENAIAAITKILAYNSSQVSVDEILPLWLNWLPVWEDEDETPHVYGFLCTLLEQNNPVLLGKENCNLPQIVAVMAEAFSREAIDPQTEVGKKMVLLLQHLQAHSYRRGYLSCVHQWYRNTQNYHCAT